MTDHAPASVTRCLSLSRYSVFVADEGTAQNRLDGDFARRTFLYPISLSRTSLSQASLSRTSLSQASLFPASSSRTALFLTDIP
jgi:uncharacterized protein YjbI with pentapeptide repeats